MTTLSARVFPTEFSLALNSRLSAFSLSSEWQKFPTRNFSDGSSTFAERPKGSPAYRIRRQKRKNNTAERNTLKILFFFTEPGASTAYNAPNGQSRPRNVRSANLTTETTKTPLFEMPKSCPKLPKELTCPKSP